MLEAGKARAFTCHGHDWTAKYWPIAKAAEALACRSADIDGEMIVLDEIGRVFFRELRSAILRAPTRLAFVAFDLLHLNGGDLRDRSLFERRLMLWELIQPAAGRSSSRKSCPAMAKTSMPPSIALGLEGMISKQRTSPYCSGRDHAVAEDQVL